MIAMALVGAAVGGLLFLLALRLAPPSTSPLVRLGQFDAQQGRQVRGAADRPAGDQRPRGERLGRWIAEELDRRGFAYTSLRQDLALTGARFEATMARKVVVGMAGFLIAVGALAGLGLTGALRLPAGATVALAVLAGAGFSFLPDVEARRQARDRRRDFRRALGCYLDLVALEMAGSAAPAEALPNAAKVGSGWPLALLRDTLFRATRSGKDGWEALSELGERIGVAELRDLGALVQLVGRDGARVRQTLTARAATMRRRELADAEGQAGQRDQSMRLAQVLIGMGFVVFVSYPAIVNVINF